MGKQAMGGRASFFKVMIGDFKQSLRVPPSFIKCLKGKLHKQAILKTHRGFWHVEVERVVPDLFFRNGWQGFVEDHSIEAGDFLIFLYDGNFGFDVMVYGRSGCEKEILIDSNSCKHNLYRKKVETDKAFVTVNKNPFINRCKYSRTKPKLKAFAYGKSNYGTITQSRRPMAERESVLKAACSIKPSNPHFVATWRLSRSCYMTIPRALVGEYDLRRKEHVILRDHLGRSWPIKIVTRNDGRVDFVDGWADFSRGNCLAEGDACVFEFIQAGDIIQAHIVRVEEENDNLVSKSGGQRNSGPVSQSEKERVRKVARSFKSHHSHFVTSWRWSKLSHVTVPPSLVRENNLRVKKSVALHDPCGRSWPVEVCCCPNGSVDLRMGWAFSRENCLREGDACVFEFVHGGDAAKMHIFRVNDTDIKGDEQIKEEFHETVLLSER